MNTADKVRATISIVNHGHDHDICNLLNDLIINRSLLKSDLVNYTIVITNNIPTQLNFKKTYGEMVSVINNSEKLGFGSNHNNCFKRYASEVFLVINPDISIVSGDIDDFVMTAYYQNSLVSPFLIEDGIKFFPGRERASIYILLKRFLDLFVRKSNHSEAGYDDKHYDWIAGVFLVIRSPIFDYVSGFDESLIMYYEDADLCRRLRLNGFELLANENLTVSHKVGRGSGKNFKLFWLHVKNAVIVNFYRKWIT